MWCARHGCIRGRRSDDCRASARPASVLAPRIYLPASVRRYPTGTCPLPTWADVHVSAAPRELSAKTSVLKWIFFSRHVHKDDENSSRKPDARRKILYRGHPPPAGPAPRYDGMRNPAAPSGSHGIIRRLLNGFAATGFAALPTPADPSHFPGAYFSKEWL